MRKIWFGLPVAIAALPYAAEAQETAAPTVFTGTISDMDDPEMIRPARPLDGVRDWLKAADFPAEAFAGSRGVDLNVVVNADDTVASCTPESPNGAFASLAIRACDLLQQRGRFLHALDPEGKARQGNVRMFVSFRRVLPGQWAGPSPAPPPRGYRNTPPVIRDAADLRLPANSAIFVNPQPGAWLDINDKGRVTRCRVSMSTGTDAGDAALCRQLRDARFEPARDPQGNKVFAQSHFVKLDTAHGPI